MTVQELAATAKKIQARSKPKPEDAPIQRDLDTTPAPDVTQMAQVSQPPAPATAQAPTPQPEPPMVTQARQALMAGGNAAPPQVAAPPATSPDEDALTARLKQLTAPPQSPTTVPGQLGQLLGGFARSGWMPPAQAQQLEMQRQGLQAGQQQQNIENTLAQLKDIQQRQYQQQELTRQNRLADIQQQNVESEMAQRARDNFASAGRGSIFSKRTGEVVTPQQPTPPSGSLTKETVLYQGKPIDAVTDLREGSPTKGKTFLQTANGLQDITGQTSHYEKPKDTSEQDAGRFDRSYQYHSEEISKIETKADEFGARLSNLRDNLNSAANNPQAQALIIPQLVAAMAGGQGSGVRINQAELNRTEGGRSNWESAQAWLQKWNTDPTKAGALTPAQLKQMGQILDLVERKHTARQEALSSARDELVHAKDEMGHRTAFQSLRTKLQQIEAGTNTGAPVGVPGVGDTFNGGKVTKVTPIPAGQ